MLLKQDEAKRKERERVAQLQWESDFRAVLATPEGKRFVFGLIDNFCGTFSGSFRAHGRNAGRITTFNEGRRSVGIDMMTQAQQAAPDAYAEMVLERTKAARNEMNLRRAEAVPAAPDGFGA